MLIILQITFSNQQKHQYYIKLFFLTFSATPIILKNITRAELPAEINGSGIPVGGIEQVTTAMFIASCMAIRQPIPAVNKAPKRLFAFSAIFIKHTTKATYARIITTAPKSPNSSPIMENIKSDSLKGKNRYF